MSFCFSALTAWRILSLLRLFLVFSPAQAFVLNIDNLSRRFDICSIPKDASSAILNGDIPRRKFQANFIGGLIGCEILSYGDPKIKDAKAHVPETRPLIDVPMTRLRLPKGGFGREYIALKMKIKDQGPYEFMLDSGLTTELITPHLREILGIQEGEELLSGLAGGGKTASIPVVELLGASIDSEDGLFRLDLPKLTAVITDFPQEHIDPAHDPVEGMLGMELLSLFDVDLDFPKNRIRLFEPGASNALGLVNLPAVVINESMLIGIRVSSPDQQRSQPILGFLDCGSTFSCLNWKAAQALGLPPNNDSFYRSGPTIIALGIDGRPFTLSTVKKQLSYVGNPVIDFDSRKVIGFESPPTNWKPWDPVQLAVGDIPAFSNILGDGLTPYEGPAALVGLDILAQRRLILKAGPPDSRRREVAIAPS